MSDTNNNTTTVFSAKISEEAKQKFQEKIKESEMTTKEFFDQLLVMLELNELKQSNNPLSEDIDEYLALTNRLAAIFNNAAQKVEMQQITHSKKLSEATQIKEQIILSLQEKINHLTDTLEEARAVNTKQAQEIDKLRQDNDQLRKTQSNELMINEILAEFKRTINELKPPSPMPTPKPKPLIAPPELEPEKTAKTTKNTKKKNETPNQIESTKEYKYEQVKIE